MRFERAESDPPTEGSNGHKDICVLVVDCDPTSLMTISGMLRALTYQGVVFFLFLLPLFFGTILIYTSWDFQFSWFYVLDLDYYTSCDCGTSY